MFSPKSALLDYSEFESLHASVRPLPIIAAFETDGKKVLATRLALGHCVINSPS